MANSSLKIMLCTLLFLTSISLCAQKQDHIWLYGDEPYDTVLPDRAADTTRGACNIDFNFDPPKLYYDPKRFLDFLSCNTSVCDTKGNMLAYTNGMTIHNQYDQAIADTINYGDDWEYGKIEYNNTIIPGGKGFIQSALILPSPNLIDRYYIFYTSMDRSNAFYNHYQVSYAEIEVGESNTTGRLISKDRLMLTDSLSGSIMAVRHGNGRDWWLVSPRRNGVEVNVFLWNEQGISLHDRYDTGFDLVLPGGGIGQVYFSPDGQWLSWFVGGLVKADGSRLLLASFDRCTGTLSAPEIKTVSSVLGLGLGVSFSYNSDYLYMCNRQYIYQYDLMADRKLDSEVEVASYDGYEYIFQWDTLKVNGYDVNFCYLGLAPDGRIYVSPSSAGTRMMSVINFPDERGQECNVRQHSISMPTVIFRGIPNFPNYRLGPLDGSPCDTLGLDNHPIAKYRYEGADTIDFRHIRFTDLSYFRPTRWVWDFGDGTGPLEAQSPYHRFARNGTYNVCLTVSNEYSSNTTCRTLVLGTVSSTDIEISEIADVSLFPNPVLDYLQVTLGDYVPEQGSMIIYDILGHEVKQQRIYYGQNSIDLSHLTSGIYPYRMMDGHAVMKVGKIVVE